MEKIPYSNELKKIIQYAREEAVRLGSELLEPQHLLLAILRTECDAEKLIDRFYSRSNKKTLKEAIDKQFDNHELLLLNADDIKEGRLIDRLRLFMHSEYIRFRPDNGEMNSVHLLLAIVKVSSKIQMLLTKFNITCEDLDDCYMRFVANSNGQNDNFDKYLLSEKKLDRLTSSDIQSIVESVIDKNAVEIENITGLDNSLFADEDDDPFPISDEEKDNIDQFFQELDERTADGRRDNKRKRRANKYSNSQTPMLDQFGVDLTAAAKENKLDPVFGRENEINRITQILSRRRKNNPVLIGEPGVGKSAIIEALATKIVKKDVSPILFDKRLVMLNMTSMVAGTMYRGQFEERMTDLIDELRESPNVILFIDEIHTIVGAGDSSGNFDAANILKPALARGEMQCIGSTTLDEYRKIERDGALERRFQKVIVESPSMEDTVNILQMVKGKYEEHHKVQYSDKAITACVRLTDRYISDRSQPDKAIDALDEAGARVHTNKVLMPTKIKDLEKELQKVKAGKLQAVKEQQFEVAAAYRDKERNLELSIEQCKKQWLNELNSDNKTISEEDIAEVVAMISGVPVKRVAQSEGVRLLEMDKALAGKIIGQDDAIAKIVRAIRRNRAGLKDPNKPIGTFIFLGPTGVGKTQLAKILAKYLFDTEDALISIDMSEYMEKFTVSRLIGAPPGYVGYEEGGQLTERIRRKPYSVVLLDEIEKAHPDTFNLLLQILDEGRLSDSSGRKIDFRNTILIMTSNIGSRQLADFGVGVGFDTKARKDAYNDNTRSVIENALKKTFSPEFLNRIDDVIQFNTLTRDDISKIIDIELSGLYSRVSEIGFKLEIDSTAKEYVIEKGYDPKYGARPLKRAIQHYVEDVLAEYIIRAEIEKINVLRLFYTKEAGMQVEMCTNISNE